MKILQELSVLNKSLSEFGLCPTDWTIIEEDVHIYKIENNEEPDFYFRGSVKFENGRKIWGSIQLVGF